MSQNRDSTNMAILKLQCNSFPCTKSIETFRTPVRLAASSIDLCSSTFGNHVQTAYEQPRGFQDIVRSQESPKHKQEARVILVASLHEQRYTSCHGGSVLTTSYYERSCPFVAKNSLQAAVAFYPFDLSSVHLLIASRNQQHKPILVYHATGTQRMPSNVCEMPSSPHGVRKCLLTKTLIATSAI